MTSDNWNIPTCMYKHMFFLPLIKYVALLIYWLAFMCMLLFKYVYTYLFIYVYNNVYMYIPLLILLCRYL